LEHDETVHPDGGGPCPWCGRADSIVSVPSAATERRPALLMGPGGPLRSTTVPGQYFLFLDPPSPRKVARLLRKPLRRSWARRFRRVVGPFALLTVALFVALGVEHNPSHVHGWLAALEAVWAIGLLVSAGVVFFGDVSLLFGARRGRLIGKGGEERIGALWRSLLLCLACEHVWPDGRVLARYGLAAADPPNWPVEETRLRLAELVGKTRP